jgi:CheY-like chemotaxis protein
MDNKPLNILLVEDNLKYIRLLKSVVEEESKSPINITDANTLEQALGQLNQHSFDMVVLDLFLPDSQGTESLNRIRQQNSKIPVVFLTALDDPHMRQKALQQGAQGYLLKDQIVDSLLPTVHDVLAHSAS